MKSGLMAHSDGESFHHLFFLLLLYINILTKTHHKTFCITEYSSAHKDGLQVMIGSDLQEWERWTKVENDDDGIFSMEPPPEIIKTCSS